MSDSSQANRWTGAPGSAVPSAGIHDSADGNRPNVPQEVDSESGAIAHGPNGRDNDGNGRGRRWTHRRSTRVLQVLAVVLIVMTTFTVLGLVDRTSNSSQGSEISQGVGSHTDPTHPERPSRSTHGTSVPTSTTSTLPTSTSTSSPPRASGTSVPNSTNSALTTPPTNVSAAAGAASAGETTSSGNSGAVRMIPSFGITMPGLPSSLADLQSLSASLGASPGIDMWYEQWSSAPDFPAADASTVVASGATPEITWEPWNPADGVNQPAYSLSAIAAGDYDSYILTWAQEIKAWGHQLMLRFAEEMNGNWTPWSEGVNGNAPGSFVAAWDHVHAIFTAAGASNVTWVWSPSVVWSTSTPLSELWPGNSEVNAVALDGYNWGPVHPDSGWQTFSQIFQESIGQVQELTQDPLYIGEVASTELGGNKAAWITDMFATLEASPEIKGFVWFDFEKETDWPIDSSPQSLAAFRAGLASL